MSKKWIKEPFGGMTQWLYQRFTALFMFVYLLIMIVQITINDVIDYISWVSIFDSWWVSFGTLIFFYLMFFHAWIGILHVTEDYIKWNAARRTVNFCFLIMIILQLLILSIFLIK